MLSAVCWTTIALFAGWVGANRLRPISAPLVPLAAALLHVLILQSVVLVAGLVSRLDRFGLWAGFVGIFVVATALLLGSGVAWRPRFRVVPALAIGIFFSLSAVIGYLSGPHVGDAQRGYLLAAADWTAHGAIVDAGWVDPVNYRPQGHGLLAAMWMTATGTVRASTIAGLHWMFVLWAGVWALARQAGASARTADWALAGTLAIPILWAMSTSGLSDLPVTACTIAALACLVGKRVLAPHLALATLALVIGAGAKYSMLPTALVLAFIACLRVVVDRRTRRRSPVRHAAVVAWCALLCTSIAASGYWYACNAWRFGNPVYPWGAHRLMRGVPEDAFGSSFGYLELRTAMVYDLLWERMWDRHGFWDANTRNGTGFGPLAAALGWPALIILTLRVRRFQPLGLSALTLFLASIFIGAPPQVWVGRFFAYFAVILMVSAVQLTPRLQGSGLRACWVTMLASCALWGIGVGVFHLPHRYAWDDWMEHGLRPTSRAQYAAESEDPEFELATQLNTLKNDARIVVLHSRNNDLLLLLHGEAPTHRFIYIYPGDKEPHYSAIPRSYPNLTHEQIERWKRAGVTHIGGVGEECRQRLRRVWETLQLTDMGGGLYAIP